MGKAEVYVVIATELSEGSWVLGITGSFESGKDLVEEDINSDNNSADFYEVELWKVGDKKPIRKWEKARRICPLFSDTEWHRRI